MNDALGLDLLEKVPWQLLLLVSGVGLALFVIGATVDVYLVMRALTHAPDTAAWTRRLRERPWNWQAFALVASTLVILQLGMAMLSPLVAGGKQPASDRLTFLVVLVSTALFQGGGLLLVSLLLRHKRLTLRTAFGIARPHVGRDMLRGALGYLAVIPPVVVTSVAYTLLLLTLKYQPEQQPVVQLLARSDSLPMTITLVVLGVCVAPVVEELVFRGIALPFLAKYVSVPTAIFAVSSLFALVHAHLPAFAPIFTLAVGLSLAYLATGSLLVPITIHACFNAISMAAALLMKNAMPT